MELKKDASGQEILAFYKGEKSFEIIERSDGYINFAAGSRDYFAAYKDWPKTQKLAIKYAHGRVLDVGTGAGRVALYLQDKKKQVTAIDNSPLAIKVCKKRGVKDARVLAIEQIDKLKPNSFDTVVMLGHNFGLFGGYKKAKILLRKLHRITGPEALMIVESANPHNTDDPVHLAYHRSNKKRGRMPGQLRIRVRFRNYASNWFDYLFVSQSEMNEILKDTGWKIRKFIDSGNEMYPVYSAIIEKE